MESFFYAENTPKIQLDTKTLTVDFLPIQEVATGAVFGYEAFLQPQGMTYEEIEASYGAANKLGELDENTFLFGINTFLHENREGYLILNSYPNVNMTVATANKIASMGGKEIAGRLIVNMSDYADLNPLAWDMKRRSLITTEAAPQYMMSGFGRSKKNDIAAMKMMKPKVVRLAKEYTDGVHEDAKKQAIVKDIIRTLHGREILVLASGIANKEDEDFLVSAGIDLVQFCE